MDEGHLIIKMICTWTSLYSKSDVQVQIVLVLTPHSRQTFNNKVEDMTIVTMVQPLH